jgi:hypothetical protein
MSGAWPKSTVLTANVGGSPNGAASGTVCARVGANRACATRRYSFANTERSPARRQRLASLKRPPAHNHPATPIIGLDRLTSST